MNRCICTHFYQSLRGNEWRKLQEKGTSTITFFIQNPLEYATKLETSLQIVILLSDSNITINLIIIFDVFIPFDCFVYYLIIIIIL